MPSGERPAEATGAGRENKVTHGRAVRPRRQEQAGRVGVPASVAIGRLTKSSDLPHVQRKPAGRSYRRDAKTRRRPGSSHRLTSWGWIETGRRTPCPAGNAIERVHGPADRRGAGSCCPRGRGRRAKFEKAIAFLRWAGGLELEPQAGFGGASKMNDGAHALRRCAGIA